MTAVLDGTLAAVIAVIPTVDSQVSGTESYQTGKSAKVSIYRRISDGRF